MQQSSQKQALATKLSQILSERTLKIQTALSKIRFDCSEEYRASKLLARSC